MIHAISRKSRDRGQGVLLVSADLDEILQLADRIIVIYSGENRRQFDDVRYAVRHRHRSLHAGSQAR